MIQQSRRICYLYCYPSKLSNVRSRPSSVLAEMAIAISVPLIRIRNGITSRYECQDTKLRTADQSIFPKIQLIIPTLNNNPQDQSLASNS